jgi:hypothetical protein
MKTDIKIPHIKRKKRKTTPKEKLATVGRFFLVCLLAPFYYGWKALKWFYETFLTEVYESGNNGICGPGYHSWEHSRLSWGKLTFLILILSILIYLIFLR